MLTQWPRQHSLLVGASGSIFACHLGLKNASSVFQRLMNAIVADLTEYAAVYINDLIIFSETFEDHIQHLRTVLQRLQERGLTLKPGRCFLTGNSCCFLGHVVGEGQIRPLEAKVKVVANSPLPLKKRYESISWINQLLQKICPQLRNTTE